MLRGPTYSKIILIMRYEVKVRNAGHCLQDSKSGILALIHSDVFEFFSVNERMK